MAQGLTISIDIAEKRFGDAPPLFAGLQISVAPGEVLAIVGPSGVGKSTLLRLVAGVDTAFSGIIRVGEHAAAAAPAPGMVFQDPRLLPWLTLEANLTALQPGLTPNAARDALARVGLASEAALYPHQLSGGMQRRAALARAIAVNPRLLLLDEPFVSLDRALLEDMRALVGELLASSGATALLVTHVLEDAARLAHRAVILGGRPAAIARDVPLPGKPRDRGAADVVALVDRLAEGD